MITEETTVTVDRRTGAKWMANAMLGLPSTYNGQPVRVLNVELKAGQPDAVAVIAPC